MRKILLLLVGVAVLWVPAVSVAGDSSQSPSKPVAKAEKPDARSKASNPTSTCQSQRSGGANAFGKCVSTAARQKDKTDGNRGTESEGKDSAESHDKNSGSPAMACKAMEANDRGQFQTTYGTRPNAFGKCVSGKAKANSKNG